MRTLESCNQLERDPALHEAEESAEAAAWMARVDDNWRCVKELPREYRPWVPQVVLHAIERERAEEIAEKRKGIKSGVSGVYFAFHYAPSYCWEIPALREAVEIPGGTEERTLAPTNEPDIPEYGFHQRMIAVLSNFLYPHF